MGFNTIIGNGWVQYVVTVVIVLVGAVIFSVIVKKILDWLWGKVSSQMA